MKKSIILSALAALALTANAATEKIKPAKLQYANINTATPLHPVTIDLFGNELLRADGVYWSFQSTGSESTKVTLELDPEADNSIEVPVEYDLTNLTLGVKKPNGNYNDNYVDLEDLDKDAVDAKITLGFNLSTSVEYVPATVRLIDGDKAVSEFDIIRTEMQSDGCYYAQLTDRSLYNTIQTGLIGPNIFNLMQKIRFIGEAEYQFMVKAREAANYVNRTNYRGGCYQDLRDAIQTEGSKWVQQLLTLNELYTKFQEQVAALAISMPDVTFAKYYDIDGEPFENVRQLTIYGAPGDLATITYMNEAPYEAFSGKGTAVIGEDGTAVVDVYFNPEISEENILSEHAPIYKANIKVTIANAHAQFALEEFAHVNTFDVAVNGIDPAMSWDGAADPVRKAEYLPITSCKKSEKVTFYTVGYGVEGTITEKIGAPQARILENNGDFKIVAGPTEIEDSRLLPGVHKWEMEVALVNEKVANFACQILVTDGTGNANNNLTLNVEGGNINFSVRGQDGEILKVVDFGCDGGEQIVMLAYENFTGVNAHKVIEAAFAEGNFNVTFPQAEEEGQTAHLDGMGVIPVIISANSARNPGITTDEITFWSNNVEQKVVVRQTSPAISLFSPADWTLNFDEKTQEQEIEIEAIYVNNVYSPADIKIESSHPHIFQISNVAYVHNGHLLPQDADKNEYHSNGPASDKDDQMLKIRVKYVPTHNTVYDGTITIALAGTMYDKKVRPIVVPLHGEKFSDAAFAALNGTATGINAATVAAENAEMYNVGGQKVNNAKGLVIKNGSKYLSK